MNSGTAGRSQQFGCDDFLASHADYVDGLLTPARTAQLAAHAATCDSCGRYDRVVRRGQALVRELPDVEPSPDFEARLRHRLYHIDDAAHLDQPRSGGMAAVAVAAVIALLAWSPLLFHGAERRSASTDAVSSLATVGAGSLLVRAADWYPGAPATLPAPTATLAMFPGPYSPLIVQPPAHRAARTVSTEYRPVD